MNTYLKFMSFKIYYKAVIFIVVFLFCTKSYAENSLIFARAPQLSPAVISKTWTPFIDYLSESTGVDISLKVYSSRSEFEKDISSGKVDLYFGNPGYGVIGHLKHGYIPIIRSSRKLLEGIVVSRKGSGINSIEQLAGKTISFPAKNAFAASLLIRYQLENNGLKFTPNYAGSHDNAYRTVMVGSAAASGGVVRTFEREKEALKNQLKIIYTTPGIKSHPVMIHPKVDEKTRLSLQSQILKLNKTKDGKRLLKTIKLQKPVITDYDKDYKELESFSSNAYKHLLE